MEIKTTLSNYYEIIEDFVQLDIWNEYHFLIKLSIHFRNNCK